MTFRGYLSCMVLKESICMNFKYDISNDHWQYLQVNCHGWHTKQDKKIFSYK